MLAKALDTELEQWLAIRSLLAGLWKDKYV